MFIGNRPNKPQDWGEIPEFALNNGFSKFSHWSTNRLGKLPWQGKYNTIISAIFVSGHLHQKVKIDD